MAMIAPRLQRQPAQLHPGYVAGRWYQAWDGTVTFNAAVPAVDRLYLYLFFLEEDFVLAGLGARLPVGGTSSTGRTAVYAVQNGVPTGLPLASDPTAAAPSGTGTATYTGTYPGSRTLQGGRWYAMGSKWTWSGTAVTGNSTQNLNNIGHRLIGEAALADIGQAAAGMRAGWAIDNAVAAAFPDLTGATLVAIYGAGLPVISLLRG
jgi:hypothetical protein